MRWRYVAVMTAFAVCFAQVARLIHLRAIGLWLIAAFVVCGIALIVERRTRG